LAASVIVGWLDTWTAPPLMAAVPDTAPVVVLNVHEDVTDVAPRLPVVLSVALTFDAIDDALVGPAVSVTVPVVSRPVMLDDEPRCAVRSISGPRHIRFKMGKTRASRRGISASS
jgi:hypothetical protein